MVDVTHRLCQHVGALDAAPCCILASYGYLGADGIPKRSLAQRCKAHKLEGMKNVISKTCTADIAGGCNTRPCYGFCSFVGGKK
jgi:hypothetical protein